MSLFHLAYGQFESPNIYIFVPGKEQAISSIIIAYMLTYLENQDFDGM